MANKFEQDLDLVTKVKHPKKYKVLLLNDDYTSMEFVVDILMNVFRKSFNEAETIMLDIHEKGKGVCGIYTYEIAESKVLTVHRRAKDSGFPLKCTMEEA